MRRDQRGTASPQFGLNAATSAGMVRPAMMTVEHYALLAIPLLPALVAPFVAWPRLGDGLRASVAAVTLAIVTGLAVWLLVMADDVPVVLAWPWVPGMSFAVRADGLSALMAVIVAGVGTAICTYAHGYFHGSPGLGRVLGLLLAFAAAMLGLVLADDVWLLFICWELTSVLSFLLVVNDGAEGGRIAGKRALLVTGAGGLALLGGVALLAEASGTSRLSEMPVLIEHAWYPWILALVIFGCATKSALFPFHFWLPGAMAAPTPVSAYLHSATMVKAGLYLLLRLHPQLGASAAWEWSLTIMGAATIVCAVIRLPRADDLKQILAGSTLIALGTIALLIGVDHPDSLLAALVVLIAHAAYKGALFMSVGCIDHGTGTRKIDSLSGLARAMPLTAVMALLAGSSLAGLPPWAGFVAKEQAKLVAAGAGLIAPIALLLAATASVAVAVWVALGPYWRGAPSHRDAHECPWTMTVPGLALAVCGLLLGLAMPWLADGILSAALAAVSTVGTPPSIIDTFPTSFSKALASLVVVGVGLGFALVRRPVARALLRLPADAGSWLWQRGLDAWLALGRTLVRTMQNGDLRIYIVLVFGLLVVAAGVPLARVGITVPPITNVPSYAMVLLLLTVVGAMATALSRRRLGAVAALGMVGYAVALIFLAFGAPDLALTQVLVETLVVILLVLAFRHLPDYQRPSGGWWRWGVAGVVGVLVGILVQGAQTGSAPETIGVAIGGMSMSHGFGANVVNVILVDFRAMDTLGEIVVLAVAALGVTVMAGQGALVGAPAVVRSVQLATVVRVLLPLMLVFALFLLWRGHNQPGGGFAGGLVAGAAAVLVGFAYGTASGRHVLLVRPLTLVAIGLLTALTAAAWGPLTGRPPLAAGWFSLPLGSGEFLKLGTPLLFDVGVFLLVVGVSARCVWSMQESESEVAS